MHSESSYVDRWPVLVLLILLLLLVLLLVLLLLLLDLFQDLVTRLLLLLLRARTFRLSARHCVAVRCP